MGTNEEIERYNLLSFRIIGACIEIHKLLGPGLLENVYEQCLCHGLSKVGIAYRRQVDIPIKYKGLIIEPGYRLDLIVENIIIVELKAIELLLPIHEAQLMTYLKLTDMKLGLLINFNVPVLKQGIIRKANNFPAYPKSLQEEDIDQLVAEENRRRLDNRRD